MEELAPYAMRLAPPWLRTHVVKYSGYRMRAAPLHRRVSVPAATVTLFFGWDAPLRLFTINNGTAEERDSLIAGLRKNAIISEISGTGQGVRVELTPLGAYSLLGLPLRELAGAMISPAEALGQRWGAELIEQLAEVSSWTRRWAVLDQVISARLACSQATPSPVVQEAWSNLVASHGTVTISDLAVITGRSRRRLETLFGEQIGLPPKTLARILRYQYALRMAPPVNRTWAETAAMCGYHDQAHLAREVRTLTGLTTTQFHAFAARTEKYESQSPGERVTSVIQ
ncbi:MULTISPECIES: helix-turn-helix domain-containing protein [Streptomyces]|uniref:Helix-turn-helix domain-containing protein n=1 Tax=Streptomyces edwardsiae TaxID=3075527 RepID=A0ABU2PTP7_9ACTN|nr:helix-turn-helix domain-containing protein [Streptomyces sp. DSM 41636]MDT0395088.1 helix-turn-helix domain-containing protein [Streptomyces sp. DSM 41636]